MFFVSFFPFFRYYFSGHFYPVPFGQSICVLCRVLAAAAAGGE
jgi:hypothetical protein